MKGYIYKLVIDGTTTIYVGSTVNLKQRRQNHKTDCFNENRKMYNRKVYKTIRERGITNDDFYNRVKIECVEEVYFNERYELGAREKFHILELKPCGNILVPYGKCKEEGDKECIKKWSENNKEKRREHYQKNKEKIKERDRQYREKNKDKIKERNKKYYQKNKDKIKEQDQEYYQKNKDEIKRKAREKYRLKKL